MIVFSVSVKVWLREGGFRNAETEILAVEFGDDVQRSYFVHKLFRSKTSTIAAISHMIETSLPQWRYSRARAGRCSFPFRLPLPRQFLRLGDLGRGHLIGKQITKLGG